MDLMQQLIEALKTAEKADRKHSNCEECMEVGQAAEACEKCFPSADDARVMRRTVLAEVKKAASRSVNPPDLRAAIIEECAKVAESFNPTQPNALLIASAIRALSASPLTDGDS